MTYDKIRIVECPRDAIQGITHYIPTEKKIQYIQQLIDSNLFDTLDIGSFVSPKAVPQMKDTSDVLDGLTKKNQQFLVIVLNERGAETAVKNNKVDDLGYPFSISETFQNRNGNSSIEEAWDRLKKVKNIADQHQKQIAVYLSMAFGNPYGEPWNKALLIGWILKMQNLGIKTLSLADTTGVGDSDLISDLFFEASAIAPDLNLGLHLHVRPEQAMEIIEKSYSAGCRKYDTAMSGYGGCPFAQDHMVGNLPTEKVFDFFKIDYDLTTLKLAFNQLIENEI